MDGFAWKLRRLAAYPFSDSSVSKIKDVLRFEISAYPINALAIHQPAYSKDIDDAGLSYLVVPRCMSEMLGTPLISANVIRKSATAYGEPLSTNDSTDTIASFGLMNLICTFLVCDKISWKAVFGD